MTAHVRKVAVAFLFVLFAFSTFARAQQVLHLSVGDPGRKDREAPLQLDVITDTRTGEAITPADLVKRLAGVRLLLIGEEHTNMAIHEVQDRIIRALHKAGRRVFIGLEQYPHPWQHSLDDWANGLLTEEGFLQLSHWYENWGYPWNYYRDIFLFARDNHIRMFALNAPREVVSAVRKKGFANLTAEESAHVPKDIDFGQPDHLAFFKATFAEETGGPMAMGHMGDDMWKSMLAAQETWDGTMGFHAVQALKEFGGDDAIMVVLVGSGHVAYGLGIEHQARQWFKGPITSIIPMEVSDKGKPLNTVRASYTNFLWGVPEEIESLYPSTGLSTAPTEGGRGLRVLAPASGSFAQKAGFKTGDIIMSMDGGPVPDRETLARRSADTRWGDATTFVVMREGKMVTLNMVFRRTVPAAK